MLVTGVIVVIAVLAVVLLVLSDRNNSAPTATGAGGQAGCAELVREWQAGGMTTTASGLQYKVLTQGNGPTPSATSSVTANYRGCLTNGTQFDSSYDRGQALTFSLTRVIRGWTEGLQLMPTGSRYLFYIPAELAYGSASPSPDIPANSPLIFEVELLGFQ